MLALRKVAVLLILVAIYSSPLASASRPRPMPENTKAATAAASQTLLSYAQAFLTIFWSKTGCSIDPNGRCINALAPPPSPGNQADTGCGIDPDGRCHL